MCSLNVEKMCPSYGLREVARKAKYTLDSRPAEEFAERDIGGSGSRSLTTCCTLCCTRAVQLATVESHGVNVASSEIALAEVFPHHRRAYPPPRVSRSSERATEVCLRSSPRPPSLCHCLLASGSALSEVSRYFASRGRNEPQLRPRSWFAGTKGSHTETALCRGSVSPLGEQRPPAVDDTRMRYQAPASSRSRITARHDGESRSSDSDRYPCHIYYSLSSAVFFAGRSLIALVPVARRILIATRTIA